MAEARPRRAFAPLQRRMALIAGVLIVTIFVVTWVSIRQSRSDSLRLLVLQGEAFTEALAQAAENAIASETFFNYLVRKRYGEIAIDMARPDLQRLTEKSLFDAAVSHNLYGLYVFGSDSQLVVGVSVNRFLTGLPDYVVENVKKLIANPEDNYLLLLDEGDEPGEKVHYYLEISNELDRVTVVVADALYYTDALKQTQIGFLAQNMAKEQGVEFIMYHTTKGIVFSSRKTGSLLAIESDPFLTQALESDSIMHRVYPLNGKNVLELVRPFSSAQYPFGLLRVGLSLDGFYSVSRGFDRQMIALSGALAILMVVVLLYLGSRQKREEIAREYSHIKSITDRIFEQIRIGVAYVRSDGAISLANAAFEGIFGEKDVVGRQWDDVVRESELALSGIVARTEDVVEREVTIGSLGQTRTLLVAVSGFSGESADRAGWVVVVYNITRLREYERMATRRERLAEMGNLAAGVAHEIRNPLNAISIAAQRLAAEFHPTENNDDYLAFTEQIRKETGRLNQIITRFLALARDDRRRHSTVRLDELLNEHLSFLKPQADGTGLELSWVVEPGLEVAADADQLREVFTNLFNNALEALRGRQGRLTISAESMGKDIRLVFEDNGPGVPPPLRETVFAPYFTTKEGGTGLGLASVHKIVSEIGGQVKVGTSRWGGAEFVVTLPKVE
jgi:two-component system sensor histidine kinase HydH